MGKIDHPTCNVEYEGMEISNLFLYENVLKPAPAIIVDPCSSFKESGFPVTKLNNKLLMPLFQFCINFKLLELEIGSKWASFSRLNGGMNMQASEGFSV